MRNSKRDTLSNWLCWTELDSPPSTRRQDQWRAGVAVVATTLLLTVDAYHTFFGSQLPTRTLLYLVIPLLIVLLIFRESPARYGFRIGDWRAGLVLTAIGWIGAAAVVLAVRKTASFRTYYGQAAVGRLPFWLADGIELFGWEFLFRGFLLFALYRACGPLAILLQAVPFALAHIGKPELETLSCIFGGAFFGYVAWRTRSFLYPFLIHWLLTSLMTWATNLG
ncbi:MAG TPA: CPBP family intramembrane metalloprotease [Thermoflexia bacterium]|nr:CPBP family intramembrane metalloprotease [Thermoflexia bacterium]